jgi:16S rRNA (guanine527-N7)-methyltransferase
MSPPTDPTGPARTVLCEGLIALGLTASAAQIEALVELAQLLERWAGRMNLTGHRGLEAIAQRLIVESAALLAQLPELPSLADLGSGAGFPGLPIAVLRPDCQVTLIEARERRHHFQRAAVRALGLENALPVLGRAESLAPTPHAAAVAQAVARPERVLRWMLPWVEKGGLLLLPCSKTRPEILSTPFDHEFSFEAWCPYEVPPDGPARGIWIARRC